MPEFEPRLQHIVHTLIRQRQYLLIYRRNARSKSRQNDHYLDISKQRVLYYTFTHLATLVEWIQTQLSYYPGSSRSQERPHWETAM